jgi:hypothetical protein
MVRIEMLQDPAISRLIATKHRKKNASQRNWPSYQGELKAMRDNVRDYGNLMIVAFNAWLAELELEAAANNTEAVVVIKIGFYCDAQTAIGKWTQLMNPSDIENYHLLSTLIRICGYAEDVAVMIHIPHLVIWQSGDVISLPHLMSHMSDAVEQRRIMALAETMTETMAVAHPTLRSFHDIPDVPCATTWPPELKPVYLGITKIDAAEIVRATLADTTQISGVPINTLYTMLTGASPPGIVPDTIKRVKAWSGKRFFLVAHPKSTVQLLYTLGSTQVMHWIGDDVCSEQASKLLVMVLPQHAADNHIVAAGDFRCQSRRPRLGIQRPPQTVPPFGTRMPDTCQASTHASGTGMQSVVAIHVGGHQQTLQRLWHLYTTDSRHSSARLEPAHDRTIPEGRHGPLDPPCPHGKGHRHRSHRNYG